MKCRLQRHAELLQAALCLTPAESAIVARLWAGGCAWVETEYLNEVTAPYARGERYRGRRRRPTTIAVHAHNIREKTGRWDFILGHVYHGFTLGAPGVRAVRKVLEQAT